MKETFLGNITDEQLSYALDTTDVAEIEDTLGGERISSLDEVYKTINVGRTIQGIIDEVGKILKQTKNEDLEPLKRALTDIIESA